MKKRIGLSLIFLVAILVIAFASADGPGVLVDLTSPLGMSQYIDSLKSDPGQKGVMDSKCTYYQLEDFGRFTTTVTGQPYIIAPMVFDVSVYKYVVIKYRASGDILPGNHIYSRDNSGNLDYSGTDGTWVSNGFSAGGWKTRKLAISTDLHAATGSILCLRIPICETVGDTFDIAYIAAFKTEAEANNYQGPSDAETPETDTIKNLYSYAPIVNETFQKGANKKSFVDLDTDWLHNVYVGHAANINDAINSKLQFVTNWTAGASLTTRASFGINTRYEFEMKIEKGVWVNGFGLRIPKGVDTVTDTGDLFGIGRGGERQPGDKGAGISFDMYNSAHQGKGVISFNTAEVSLGESPFVAIPYPSGFDIKALSKYTIYDFGNSIEVYIKGSLWAKINLLANNEIKVYNGLGEQVTFTNPGKSDSDEITFAVATSGKFGIYGRGPDDNTAGHTIVDNITIDWMSLYSDTIKDTYNFNSQFIETFQNGGTNKTLTELDSNWIFGLGHPVSPNGGVINGQYAAVWRLDGIAPEGSAMTTKTSYGANTRYEFEMKGKNPGGIASLSGFGLRIPSDVDGALYGMGRADMDHEYSDPGGAGISFDMYHNAHIGNGVIAFNKTGVLFNQSPWVAVPYPAGFNIEVLSKYTIYDFGDSIEVYIEGALWAKISFLANNKVRVYDGFGVQVGAEISLGFAVETNGRLGFYCRVGDTTFDNVKISSMSRLLLPINHVKYSGSQIRTALVSHTNEGIPNPNDLRQGLRFCFENVPEVGSFITINDKSYKVLKQSAMVILKDNINTGGEFTLENDDIKGRTQILEDLLEYTIGSNTYKAVYIYNIPQFNVDTVISTRLYYECEDQSGLKFTFYSEIKEDSLRTVYERMDDPGKALIANVARNWFEHTVYNNNIANPSLSYGGVDDLGRKVGIEGDANIPTERTGKYVGIFYFLWVGAHGTEGPYDNTKIIAQYPDAKTNVARWGAEQATHFWGEPLFGYYRANDPWVMRKHVQMLTDAGVDFLVFDTTNSTGIASTGDFTAGGGGNSTYVSAAMQMIRILDEYYQQGYKVPKVAFYTNTNTKNAMTIIHNEVYKAFPEYSHLWFNLGEKPMIIGDSSKATSAVKTFFTIRENQWPNENKKTNGFPWMEFGRSLTNDAIYGTGSNSIMNVSIAQHNVTGRMSTSAWYNGNDRTRSFHNGAVDKSANAILYGYNFAEQWEFALSKDPSIIFITGWNEWAAQRQPSISGQKIVFVDCANAEASRDAEPMRGGYGDNYYLQMMGYIKRFKGTEANITVDSATTIALDNNFSQWNNIKAYYKDYTNDIVIRNHGGFGTTIYTNGTGRNDINEMKVCSDSDNIYFLVTTANNLTSPKGNNWMNLYIQTGNVANNSWNGYDFILNRATPTNGKATLEKCTANNSFSWTKATEADYVIVKNSMMVKIPKSALGITTNSFTIQFKWTDNCTSGDIFSFYTDGDSAPIGRLNYVYSVK